MRGRVSYGIVLLHEKEALMYQRRDTYAYLDFVRGFWTSEDDVKQLIFCMTEDEKFRLKHHNFSQIWNDVFLNRTKNFIFYNAAFSKWLSISHKINEFISLAPKTVHKPSLGFPKGLRDANETCLECAMREFYEETTISVKRCKLVEKFVIVEDYIGTNGKRYKTEYYVFVTPIKLYANAKLIRNRIRQWTLTPESMSVKWIDKDDIALFTSKKYSEIANVAYNMANSEKLKS